jgi:hypothetical protein
MVDSEGGGEEVREEVVVGGQVLEVVEIVLGVGSEGGGEEVREVVVVGRSWRWWRWCWVLGAREGERR